MGTRKADGKASARRSASGFSFDYQCAVSLRKAKGRSTARSSTGARQKSSNKG